MQVILAKEIVKQVPDGAWMVSQGMGAAAVAEELLLELENRFLETGHPTGLHWIHSSGQGYGHRGLNHIGHEGMLGWITGGHYGPADQVQKLVMENKIEAYNWPQGVISTMFRDIAGRRPTLSKIGLHTFVDPRLEGGKLNARTQKDTIKVAQVEGEEYLYYCHPPRLDFAFLRGTYADEKGNISLEGEGATFETLSVAQALHNTGGKVVVQVREIVKTGSLDPRLVHIPAQYVDYVVPVQDAAHNHMMTFNIGHEPALCGDCRKVLEHRQEEIVLNAKRLIGRRCVMELQPNSVINLGIGIPDGIGMVADEEGVSDQFTLSVESGPIGGVPTSAKDFGCAYNPEAILPQNAQFDGYDGGGLNLSFLGLAEVDAEGSLNVSKFGPKAMGAGGFINIAQSTPKVVFCGTLTAVGLEIEAKDGRLAILKEGKVRKFVKKLQQVTFSGPYAVESGQEILYVTERAVFRLTREGLMLTEIAPGIDLQTQVLDQMEFLPLVSPELKQMDPRIFRQQPMGLQH
ncbi:MAG: 3-oxoacid CoA-transferase [Clostridiales bacterium]|nr:3-oxoacid CoA-transferase [Clostridiales bacterium]